MATPEERAMIDKALKSSQKDWERRLWARLLAREQQSSPAAVQDLQGRRKSCGRNNDRFEPYQYRKLPGPGYFRLLRLVGILEESQTVIATIRTCKMDTTEPYAALSYTWGPPTDEATGRKSMNSFLPRCTLAIFDQDEFDQRFYDMVVASGDLHPRVLVGDLVRTISINQNLSDFLHHYLDPDMTFPGTCLEYLLWIDALCINQNDATEKALQINCMGGIYANARFVLVWLGPVPKEDPQLANFVWMNNVVLPALEDKRPKRTDKKQYYMELTGQHSPVDADFWTKEYSLQPKGGDWLACWHGFCRFIKSMRWFSRCWIMQEYCLAQQAMFLCGSTMFKAEIQLTAQLKAWIRAIEEFKDTRYSIGPSIFLLRLRDTVSPYASRPGCITEDFSDPNSLPTPLEFAATYFGNLLEWSRMRETTNLADHVYSVLGTVTQLLGPSEVFSQAVQVRRAEASPAKVFLWAATLILTYSPTLELLSQVEPREYRRLDDLPSWVPDYSVDKRVITIADDTKDATLMGERRMLKPEIHGNVLRIMASRLATVAQTIPAYFGAAMAMLPPETLRPYLQRSFQAAVGKALEQSDAGLINFCARASVYFANFVSFTTELQKKADENLVEILQEAGTAEDLFGFLLAWYTMLGEKSNDVEKELETIVTLLCYSGATIDEVADQDQCVLGRCLFLAVGGYPGVGHITARPGDEVWLLEGGKVPYILRQGENGRYTFLGECYMSGAMAGEMMTEEVIKAFAQVEIV